MGEMQQSPIILSQSLVMISSIHVKVGSLTYGSHDLCMSEGGVVILITQAIREVAISEKCRLRVGTRISDDTRPNLSEMSTCLALA